MRLAVGILLVLALFGCASSTSVLLIGKTSGELGTGTFDAGGHITIRLKNKTYTGTWDFIPQDSAGSGFGVGTGGVQFGRTSGLGTLPATAPDGTSVLCRYAYDNRSKGGNGECRETETGQVFDMQVR